MIAITSKREQDGLIDTLASELLRTYKPSFRRIPMPEILESGNNPLCHHLHETIDSYQIGTCKWCGQKRQYYNFDDLMGYAEKDGRANAGRNGHKGRPVTKQYYGGSPV